MDKLTTGNSPSRSIKSDLYVSPERAIADRLVARIDLQPTSAHLVVGGVGTGKTTQLLVAREGLRDLPDTLASYIDVSLHHDLSHLASGVLVVIAGLALSSHLAEVAPEEEKKTREEFRVWAHGRTTWVVDDSSDDPPEWADDDDPPLVPVRYEPILRPPAPPLDIPLKAKAAALQKLSEAVQKHSKHIVLIFDSLDRMADLNSFAQVVTQDVRAIRQLGIGVVLVGPLTVIFGTHRPTADSFDYTYHVSAVDVDSADGPSFLTRVLLLRVPPGMIGENAALKAVRASGGVFRDLLAITRAAGEEAYLSGADEVLEKHVEVAAENFGRTLLLGLGEDEIAVLQKVKSTGQFIQTSDKHIALLATRRVLEYGEGNARFKVHPTIAGLLDQLASTA